MIYARKETHEARRAGLLQGLAPSLFALLVERHGGPSAGLGPLLGALAAAALVVAGARLLDRRERAGRLLATGGVGLAVALALATMAAAPGLALVVLLAAGSLLVWLWESPGEEGLPLVPPLRPSPSPDRLRARWTAAGVAASWFLVVVTGWSAGLVGYAAVLVGDAAVFVEAARWLRTDRAAPPAYRQWLGGAGLVALAGVGFSWGSAPAVASWPLVVPLAVLLLTGRSAEPAAGAPVLWELLLSHPARLLVGTFLALCLVGTVLLALPVAARSGESIGLLDAAFTAVSAVCVTGLIVRDTPVDFGPAGQAMILLLIQLGGLGIMSFSTVALALLGRRLSLRHEAVVATLLSGEDRSRLFRSLGFLLGLTFVAEAVGATLLAILFARTGDGAAAALWRGVFTSVSAFCNAGFSLQSTSLVPYREVAPILHTVAVLIVLGGLSPATVAAVPALVRRRPAPVQAKLVLVTTAVLLLVGTAGIAAFEWTNTLRGLSPADKLHNAWFQSVTLRTAGFNTIDIAAIRPATLTLMALWMFVGGSPGGTAGGIKTTTLAVLVLAAVSAMRGRAEVTAFGRSIPPRTIYKAAAIATVGGLVLVGALTAIQLTQPLPTAAAFFEVVSALGTVGLTMGATAALDEVGKLLIMVSMFMGRVGPLTLFIFLAGRSGRDLWRLPEEDVDVG